MISHLIVLDCKNSVMVTVTTTAYIGNSIACFGVECLSDTCRFCWSIWSNVPHDSRRDLAAWKPLKRNKQSCFVRVLSLHMELYSIYTLHKSGIAEVSWVVMMVTAGMLERG